MDIYDLPVSYPNLAVVFIAGIVVLQYLPGDELYRDIISLYKVKSSAKTCGKYPISSAFRSSEKLTSMVQISKRIQPLGSSCFD